MKKKADIRLVAGLPDKVGKRLSSKKDPLKDLSTQDVRNLLNILTRQNEELLRAQKKIETSRQRYADLYDFAPIAYFVFDTKGRIIEANRAGVRFLGKTKSSVMRMHFKSFISRDDRDLFEDHRQQTLEKRSVQTCEVKLNGPNGTTIFARLQSTPADDDSGNPVMIRTAVTDITKLKRSEEFTKRLASFPQLNPNPVIEVDSSGKIVYSNKAAGDALEQLGMDRGDLTPFLPADIDVILGGLKKNGALIIVREVCIKDRVFGETINLVPQFGVARLYIRDITERKRAEEELCRAKAHLEMRVRERTEELFEKSRILGSFLEHTQTCLVFLDKDFNFIRVNEAYAKTCSRQVTDFQGHNHFVDYPSEELRAKFQQVVKTKQPYSAFKRPFTFPGHPERGTTYWDLAVAPVMDAEGEVDFLVFSLVDVTERELALDQVFHVKRLYSMLSSVNEAIMRVHDPDQLYHEICRISVEEGLFKMAWIGLSEPDTRMVVPVASYADTGGYLDTITIYAADVPEGRGPTGRAIREGKNMICSDIEYDPIILPWRDKALKQGFRSSAAIPFRQGGSVIGAFTIYADTPQFFTDEELSLLTSLADNISFALDAMSSEKMRLDAEITLRQSAEEIQDLYNNAPCGYHSIDKDGTIVRINDTELKWLGYTREEVIGKKKIFEFYTPEGVERFKKTYPAFVERGSVADLELDLVRRDGSVLSVLLNGTAIRDSDGNFLMSRSTMFDITDRKEAEQRIRANNELLKLFAQKYSLSEYLDAVCGLVRMWSGCLHVGFRIIDENSKIPFLASIDYDPDFLKREGTLSLVHDQCICTRVISGRPEPSDLTCMTPGGSFISGNTSSFTETLPDDQRTKYRGVCMQAGFKSLAVVPIRYRDQALGAIHIADEREGAVTLKKMEFIEQLAVIVGEAIYRFSADEELRKSREELRNLNKYLRESREKERTAIAREIHDELGQIITALRLELAWISNNYRDHDRLFNKSKSMLALVDSTIQTIQNIIAELRPGILDVLGLFAAIEWQAAELKKMSGITCDLMLPPEDVPLSADISTNIFRIIQELFTNIVRYSKATNVSVKIEIKRDRLFLNVTDNGIGIRPQDVSSPVSFGIIGIRERVYAMKGEMHIAGTSGMGTSVTIVVPVHAGQSVRPE